MSNERTVINGRCKEELYTQNEMAAVLGVSQRKMNKLVADAGLKPKGKKANKGSRQLSDAFSLTDLTLLKEEKLRKVEQQQAKANSQAISIIENKQEVATAVFTQLVENADAVDLTIAMHKVNDALMSRIVKLTTERDTALAQIGRADKETSIEIFAVDNNYGIAKKWAGVISKKLIARGFTHNGKKITDSGKYPAIMWDRIILNQNKDLFEAYDDVD